MPEIIVVPSWSIPKLTEDQKFVGTLRSDEVYRITTEDDTTTTNTDLSIKNVITKTIDGVKKMFIVPNIIFNVWGFENSLTEEDNIDVSTITKVTHMYVLREVAPSRPKCTSDDPFVFTFVNSKTGNPFNVSADPNHFVGVAAVTPKGNVMTHYGYLVGMSDDGSKLMMDTMSSAKGIFKISEVQLPIDGIKGLYFYNLNLVEFENKPPKKARTPKVVPMSQRASADETTEEKTSSETVAK